MVTTLPAPITLPNLDGLPPGTVLPMFSFDHDVADFVPIGAGQVTPDGSVSKL